MLRPSRAIAVSLGLLASLSLGVAPVAAVSEQSTSGQVGVFVANDSLATPGGRCEYDPSARLRLLSARAPVVFARRAGGQQVGWQLKVVRNYELPNNPGQYADETVYRSRWQKDRATRSNPADLTRKSWVVSGTTSDSTRYKVWVNIRWYRPSDGKVEGRVSFRYDWFKETAPFGDKTDQIFFCYRSYF